jgi:3-oxoadipate enol-lactonase
VTLHHLLDGPEDAPVLVLPCSLGTTTALWEPQLASLGRSHRLLRYDHRGHGGSPVPPGPYSMEDLGRDALELLDELGLERVSWCGLSLGGMVGMWVAGTAPERIDRLVLACTAARMAAPDVYRERAPLVRAEGIEPIADGVVARWFTEATARTRPELVARFRSQLVETPAEGYAACCEALADWDFVARLGAIEAPTLVVAGSEDEATPQAQTQELADRIPDASLATIPGAAHLANVERPDAFADAVLVHLEAA